MQRLSIGGHSVTTAACARKPCDGLTFIAHDFTEHQISNKIPHGDALSGLNRYLQTHAINL